jgi:cyclopropane-fatty-acyl-phospholipid synthase
MKNTDLRRVLPTPIERSPSQVPPVWSIRQRLRSIVEGMFARADVRIDGSRPWDIRVHRDRFFGRVLSGADLAFGESYMDGDWSCDRLDELATRIFTAGLHQRWHAIDIVETVVARFLSRQTRARVRRHVAPHYDLGNDLFEAMLDTRHMAYTCAYWRSGAQTLEDAQEAKLDLVCRKLTLERGMRLLDIGCGWGGLARFAATRYGVSVTGITLSQEQARLGSERSAGLPVDIRVQDYRDVTGQFDRVVSVGCLEHVGHRNHRRFFETIRARLGDGGHALVHSIGVSHTQYRVGRFLDKYVFPLVNLPSMAQIGRSVDGLFVVDDVHNIGTDYGLTLMAWHERFDRAWPRLASRYGDLLNGRFKRMFEFYLLMTAGFFRARQAQVWQMVLTPPGGGQPACRCT